MIRFGPAGFQYKDWEGIVYPSPRPAKFDPLAYLAHYFDAVEINSTFYGPARPKTAESWVRRVEHNPGFRFTAKLYQRFTHQRKTAWTKDEVAEVSAGMDVMMKDGRLGALLLQFPWSFRNDEGNREWLDDVTKTFAAYPLVVEVRHASWNVPEFFATLMERGIGFVNIDQPQFKRSIKPSAVATSHIGYVRVHGRNYKDWFRKDAGRDARYDYLYPPDELKPWAERTKELAEEPETEDVFVVTNNHYRGKAVANALMLQAMVEGRKAPAPPPLLAEYGDALKGYAEPAEPDTALAKSSAEAPEAPRAGRKAPPGADKPSKPRVKPKPAPRRGAGTRRSPSR